MTAEVEIVGLFRRLHKAAAACPGMGHGVAGSSGSGVRRAPGGAKGDIRRPGPPGVRSCRRRASGTAGPSAWSGSSGARTSTATFPPSSQRARATGCIKDDVFAVWITGRKPKGSGWELDAGLKRDTGKWIEVMGVPRDHQAASPT